LELDNITTTYRDRKDNGESKATEGHPDYGRDLIAEGLSIVEGK